VTEREEVNIPEVDLARKRGVVNAMIQLVIYQPEERLSVVSRNLWNQASNKTGMQVLTQQTACPRAVAGPRVLMG